jgi:hypothetical protein
VLETIFHIRTQDSGLNKLNFGCLFFSHCLFSNFLISFVYQLCGVAFPGGIIIMFRAGMGDEWTGGDGISVSLQLAISSWFSLLCFFRREISTPWLLYWKRGKGNEQINGRFNCRGFPWILFPKRPSSKTCLSTRHAPVARPYNFEDNAHRNFSRNGGGLFFVELGIAELTIKITLLGTHSIVGLIFGLGWGLLGYCPGAAGGALDEGHSSLGPKYKKFPGRKRVDRGY